MTDVKTVGDEIRIETLFLLDEASKATVSNKDLLKSEKTNKRNLRKSRISECEIVPVTEFSSDKSCLNGELEDDEKALKDVSERVEHTVAFILGWWLFFVCTFISFSNLPIDRGWAWVILIAFVATNFVVIGQMKCSGIVFVHLQERYGSSSSATSLIYTLMNAADSLSALFVLTVGSALSVRKSVTIGATISSVASLITAFIHDVRIAMVTVGLANGFATGFIMLTSATLVNTYFVNRRGFANNVGNSGVSLGAIALSPILTVFFEQFGYTGAFILITGLNLQLFVIAALLRPMRFYAKPLGIEKSDPADTKVQSSSFTATITNSVKKIFDRKLLTDPVFLYYLLCNFFLCSGCALASAFLPPLAVDCGESKHRIGLMVSIIMSADFCARFVFGYISDKKICHRSTLIAIASFTLGVAAQFLHFTITFSNIMIYAVTAGLLQGVYFSLFVVVVLDILSFNQLKGALGYVNLVQGISASICVYFIGKIRDETGNYAYTFNFVGSLLLIGSVLVYFVPSLHYWNRKREALNHDKVPVTEMQEPVN